MGNPIFGSKTIAAANAILETDSVTVTRVGAGRSPTVTTIYSGNGSLQEGGGQTYFNPGGVVEVADALLIISNTDASSLPAVAVGDLVTRQSDGKTFSLVSTSSRTWALPHLELLLKRGSMRMEQPS